MTSVKWIGISRSTVLERSARASFPSPERSRPVGTLPPLMVVAIWFGLVSGLLELGLVYARNHLVGWSTLSSLQISRHFPWMIPVANLALFLAWGLLVAVLGRVWKRIGGQTSIALLSFPACLAPLLLLPGLYWTAHLALAGALAMCIGKWVWAVRGRFCRLVITSLPVVCITTCLFSGWKASQMALAERWAIRSLPIPAQNRMNVLLLVMDTVRADHLGLYGYRRPTSPNLERIAARGATFRLAQATAPWTLPSHASMLTGLWPHRTGVSENRPLDAGCPTLAEFLKSRGYLTAGFVANTYFCNSWFGLGRGFTHYEDFYDEELVVSVSEALRSSSLGRGIVRLASLRLGADRPRKTAARINRDFLDWLSVQDAERPFFVFLNYFDAHSPYIVPAGSDRPFAHKAASPAELELLRNWNDRRKKNIPESEASLVSDSYDDCISYIDSQIGELMDELERRGLLRNTLVVITSDHGEELGEHGLFGHGLSLYSQELHVPLVILAPEGPAPHQVVDEPVSLRDLPATCVDLLGHAHDSPFLGKSLARYWKPESGQIDLAGSPTFSEVALRDKVSKNCSRAPAWRGPMQSVITNGRAYIRNADGQAEVYDITNDPTELCDLAGKMESQGLLRLREVLQSQVVEDQPNH
jgi:arylsulfatase A-like enzyme